MEKKAVSGIMLTLLLLTSMLTLAFNIPPAKAWTGTVYIRADGSIDPSDAPIITFDNITYTLTDNITSTALGIVVERNNIVIDGAGYTLQGTQAIGSRGINLEGIRNVTIKNTNIKNFYYGIRLSLYLAYYSLCRYINISGNNITNNQYGVWLSDTRNSNISGNIIANNQYGIRLSYIWYPSIGNIISRNNITNNGYGVYNWGGSSNKFYHNNFIDNTQQVSSDGYANVWDDGYPSGGNYWSDYTDVDLSSGPYQNETGSDGIWDHPYVIDANNTDRYPLVNPWTPLPEEVGLLVDVTPKTGGPYYVGDTIEFQVTVTNPTNFTGINIVAYHVWFSLVAPEEVEVLKVSCNVGDINSGESKNGNFTAKAKKAGDNVEIVVNAYGEDHLLGTIIAGRGKYTFSILDPEAPKPDWSFAIIADPHIGYGFPDYDGEGWDDSGGGEHYPITALLESAVKTIVSEKDYYNIKFVAVLGDFADTAEKSEFLKAREILNKLNDAGIPYIPVVGDHDQWPYTQKEGANPDDRRASVKEKASYAKGDEWFNDIFWSESNSKNLDLIEGLFGVRPRKAESCEIKGIIPWHTFSAHLQNRNFSYGGINFVCLDFNPRAKEPGTWGTWVGGNIATHYQQTKDYLENYLENHQDQTTIILSHHPLYEWGGFFQADEIAEIIYRNKCSDKTYNFAGHTHCDRTHYQLSDLLKGYYVIETEPVSQIEFEYPFTDIPVCKLTEESIRIVQVKDGKIDYSTTLKPSRGVTILTPFPDFVYSHASYPEPNKEITFTAHFTTYHGFKTSFDWDFGDGTFGSGSSVKHTYPEDDEYNVTLTVTIKNLITGEERTQTVTGPVYVHSKHVISHLPSDLYATSLLTREDLTQVPKNTYQPVIVTKTASEMPIAQLGVHFEEATKNINFSSLIADVDLAERKSILYMPSWPAEIEEYKLLFIPSTGAGTVYICSNATSLDEVSLENADVIINVGETKDGITVTTTFYNGKEYYLVSGVTGTGGGELLTPVGGVWIPVNKLALLVPYIGLASTIISAIVAITVFIKLKKRKTMDPSKPSKPSFALGS